MGVLPAILRRVVRYSIYGLIVYFLWVGAKSAWDCHCADRLAKTAAQELEDRSPVVAMGLLKEALSLCPENSHAARVMARLLDDEGSAQAIPYHLIVLDSGDATEWDRCAFIDSAMRHPGEPGALELAVKVAEEMDDPAMPHLIRASAHQHRGEMLESEEELRSAVSKRPAADTWIALARLLISQPDRAKKNAEIILGLLNQAAKADKGLSGFAAIEIALKSGLVTPDQLDGWLEMLRSHPAADIDGWLAMEAIALDINPGARDRILDGLLQRSVGVPAHEKPAIASWLLHHNEAERIGAFWTLNEAAASGGDAFLIWLDTVAASAGWEQVESALEDPSNPLDQSLALAVRSNAAMALGDFERSLALGREAISHASSTPNLRLEVAKVFLKHRNFTQAARLLVSLLQDPEQSPQGIEALKSMSGSGYRAAEILGLLDEVLKSPGVFKNEQMEDRADRLRLVLGGSASDDILQERAKKMPANPSLRLTLALAQLLQGKIARAGYEIGLIETDFTIDDLNASDRLVLVCVFAANGKTGEASRLLNGLSEEEVTPEEYALAKRYLGGSTD